MSIFLASNVTDSLPKNIPKTVAYLEKSTSCDSFRKKARSKFFTVPLVSHLADIVYEDGLKTPLEKSYRNSIYCADSMVQNGLKITSRYCGNRWCTVCSRIRTAKLINGYLPEIDKLEDKYFVTLTLRNCTGDELRNTIEEMKSIAKSIKEDLYKSARYKKNTKNGEIKLKGLQKLECTWNRHENSYHPHFHYIIEGADAAYELIYQWLMRVPANPEAQDIQPCRKNSEKEIFKYFTKIVTKIGKEEFRTFVRPLDTIFVAMRGMNVFSSYGLKKNVTEDIDNLQSEIIDISADKRIFFWVSHDWHEITEEGNIKKCLTGYTPSDAMIKITDSMDTVLDVKLMKLKEGDEIKFTYKDAITEKNMNYLFGYVDGEDVALSYGFLWKNLPRDVGKTFQIKNTGLKDIKNKEFKMFTFSIEAIESPVTNIVVKKVPTLIKTIVENGHQIDYGVNVNADMPVVEWRETFAEERRVEELISVFDDDPLPESLTVKTHKLRASEKIEVSKKLAMKEGDEIKFTYEDAISNLKGKFLYGRVNGVKVHLSYSDLWEKIKINSTPKLGKTYSIKCDGMKGCKHKMLMFIVKEIEKEKNY